MGGKALKNTTVRRVTTVELKQIFDELQPILLKHYSKVLLPPTLQSKADHGDVDIVVATSPTAAAAGAESPQKEQPPQEPLDSGFNPSVHLPGGTTEWCRSGPVLSFEFRGAQVDLIHTTAARLDMLLLCIAYGDTGMIVGFLLRQLGLKLSPKGVFARIGERDFALPPAGNAPDVSASRGGGGDGEGEGGGDDDDKGKNNATTTESRKEKKKKKKKRRGPVTGNVVSLLLSSDPERILAALQLDRARWAAGFADQRDVFEWIARSPCFTCADVWRRARIAHLRRSRDGDAIDEDEEEEDGSTAPSDDGGERGGGGGGRGSAEAHMNDGSREHRRRVGTRRMYAEFLEFVEARGAPPDGVAADGAAADNSGGGGDDDVVADRAVRDGIVAALGMTDAVAEVVNKERLRRELKGKFNSALVKSVTGLPDGIQLGKVMAAVKIRHTAEQLFAMDADEIKQVIEECFSMLHL